MDEVSQPTKNAVKAWLWALSVAHGEGLPTDGCLIVAELAFHGQLAIDRDLMKLTMINPQIKRRDD